MMKRVPLRLIAAASLSGLMFSQASALEIDVPLEGFGYFDTTSLNTADLTAYTTPAIWEVSRKCRRDHLSVKETGPEELSSLDRLSGDSVYIVGTSLAAIAGSAKTKSGSATVVHLPPPCPTEGDVFAFGGFGDRSAAFSPPPRSMAMNATVDLVDSTRPGVTALIAAELAFAADQEDSEGKSLAPVPLPMALPPLVFSLAAAGFGFRLLRGKREIA